MNLFIFSKETEIYAPTKFLEEAKKRGHEAQHLHYKDLAIHIGPVEVTVLYRGRPLEIPDAAILRVSGAGLKGPLFVYQRVALIDYLPPSVFVTNKTTYVRWPRLNKLEQHYSLVRAGLPVLTSYSFSSVESIDWERIGFPVIAKTAFGSSGQGVFKLENKKEVRKVADERGVNNLLFQRFLTTREDYRVIVIGGKALPQAMKKIAQEGDFLTNYARGGRVEGVELTPELKRIAEETAKVFQTDYAGVDVMYDDQGKPFILEINRGAQFQGFEESTGISVASYMLDFLEEQSR